MRHVRSRNTPSAGGTVSRSPSRCSSTETPEPRGCVPWLTCASCCGSPSSTIPRAAPAIASASASAICPASSTNSTSTAPRSSSRAHSHGVPAIRRHVVLGRERAGVGGGGHVRALVDRLRVAAAGLLEARGTRCPPPPRRARPRRAGWRSPCARSPRRRRRLPAREQLADQPRARVGLARAGRALDEQRRAAEVGDPLAERARRAAAAASAAAARTRRSGPEIAPVACSASARSAACWAVCGIGLGGISARRQRLVRARPCRA